MVTPYLVYADIVDNADNSGYVPTPKLSQLSASLLLSLCVVGRMRWLWQSPLDKIDDSEYDNILDLFRDAEANLMSSFAVGSIISSFVDLDSENSLLRLDGQTVAQVDYVELSAVCPSGWLSGSNIILPDMDDKSIHGGYASVGGSVGSNSETLTTSQIPSHNHTQNPHTHLYNNPLTTPALGGAIPATASIVVPTPLATGLATATNNPAGGDGSHNNIPESQEVIYYIVAL